MYDLFTNLIKYRSNGLSTPLENFTTELFVYIWKYLIHNNKKLARNIFMKFGIAMDDEELNNITIETQKSTTILFNKKRIKLIPDIWVTVNGAEYIIEVKVNSGLNQYKFDEKYYDQINLYKKIPKVKLVKTLTKNVVFCSVIHDKDKILWSEIYNLFESSNELLIINFLHFLKENGMAPNEPITESSLTVISVYASLLGIIETSWNISKYTLERSIDPSWLGFYIKKSRNKVAWIGQLIEKQDHLVFELLDSKLVKKAKKIEQSYEKDSNGNIIFAELALSEIIKNKSNTEQKKVVQKWINDEVSSFI